VGQARLGEGAVDGQNLFGRDHGGAIFASPTVLLPS
jgi:hypothetical protein